MPRRRAGTLLPLETSILETGIELQRSGDRFHGFQLAAQLAAGDGGTDDSRRALTAHGTLYKALGRMAEGGLLDAAWEDQGAADASGRPRRRLYRVTPDGVLALAGARAAEPASRGHSPGGSLPIAGRA